MNNQETRIGWADAFAQMHEKGDDKFLLIEETPKQIKPIFVVRVPDAFFVRNSDVADQELNDLVNALGESYYVLLLREDNITSMAFEMFSVNKATEVEFEEFKKNILSRFENE